MQHRRGLDLIPPRLAASKHEISVATFAPDGNYFSVRFAMIPAWWVLGGICIACRRIGEVDRFDIERRHGRGALVHVVGEKLRCTRCGERGRCMFILHGKMLR